MINSNSAPNLQTSAYDQIRQDIIFCTLIPGQKISVKTMEDNLGIGRTPVREALVRLSQQGLVQTVPQSGTYVSRISLREAENARYVREHLEKSITVECCAHVDDAAKAKLASLFAQQQEAVAKRDARAFFHLDNLLHERLFIIADRHEIWRWIDSNNTDLERFRWLRTQVSGLEWETIMDQHKLLLDAICNRRPEEARFISGLHLHLMNAEQEIVTSAFPDYFAS